ncbi:unnamed protein product [Cuscuta campestris]|uniref:F-box domain-containing protein n=1 Tax=Cuscuta campestris TaxID=132261 RepID=A0A484L6C5_9ASTE|nr:unnamed protein product [Cuscuta campestris]
MRVHFPEEIIIPVDIILQILLRLPVKSAVKCTAVCKTWYALIKDPSFISNHLQQAASLCDDLLLLRFTRDRREFYHLRRDNDAFEELKQLQVPFRCSWIFRLVGTCNGLVCLGDVHSDDHNIILWNPSIHKHFILPKPDFPFKSCEDSTLGFGFDPVSNDYKVLLVVSQGDREELTEVWLFSLNRRSWMRLSGVSPKHCCYAYREASFVKVHFVPQMSLIKYEESIAVASIGTFEDLDDNQLELWVMKEYGVDSSWTKVLHSIDENGELVFDSYLLAVIGVRKNGEVLLKVGEEHGIGYELATLDLNCDQQEQQLKRLGIRTDRSHSFVGNFVESVVLLDKGEQDAEEEV